MYCYTSEEPPATPARSNTGSAKRTHDGSPGHNKALKIDDIHSPNTKGAIGSDEASVAPVEPAQLAVSNVLKSMKIVQKHIDEARRTATHTVLSLSNSNLIEWDDLLAILPPLTDLRKVINCFFTEVSEKQRFPA
jgi:hypothetical protein